MSTAPRAPTLSIVASAPAGPAPVPTRRVALWCDDAGDAPALAEALRGEGLTAIDSEAGDALEADALLLCIAHGLSSQLGRLREWRRLAPFTPLVVACQPLRELDQVLALEMGADDVLDAAWSAAVVAARLRALWRRSARDSPATAVRVDVLRFGALSIHLREREVLHRGRKVPLTEGEFEVLWLLACHAGTALSRRDILSRVRGIEDQPLDRSIDSRVYRIRAKLGDQDPQRQRIRTVRHRGYVFSPVGW